MSGYFLHRTGELTPEMLASQSAANELMTLVEVDPNTFLPLLARVVTNATEEQLAWGAAGSPVSSETYWRLVRLGEGLGNMPEYSAGVKQFWLA